MPGSSVSGRQWPGFSALVRKKIIPGLLIILAAAAFALLGGRLGLLTGLENITWQWRAAYFADPAAASGQVRIIALDQQSLDWGSRENQLSWPWPRQAYEVLLAFCRRAGVKVVVFDLLFSEPSLYGVEDDRALGAALRQYGPVVIGHTLAAGEEEGQTPAVVETGGVGPLSWLKIAGYDSWRASRASRFPSFVRPAALPVPEIAAGAAMFANLAARPDSDGVFRRAALFADLAGRPLPAPALAAWLAASSYGVSGSPAAADFPTAEARLSLADDDLLIGSRSVPLDREGRAILNFRGPGRTLPTVSAAAVIQSELLLRTGAQPTVDPAWLRDSYVFFGLTAPGLHDLRATPLDGVAPGVEIHATMLDNLLTGDFLREAPPAWNFALTLAWAGLAAAVILSCRQAWQSGLALAALLPWPLFAGFFAYGRGIWLPVAEPVVALGLALVGGLLFNFATEGRKKRYIKRAFSQYLHPTVIEQLLNQPERLRLGGERRELSIFFSDLQGFTTISERLEPERLTLLLNEYLSAMTDCLLAAGGTIDKYEGDAIIAFWNAPLAQPDHAERAVRAALRCQARLTELRPDFLARFGSELYMRVGLNTGPVVVGNLGSSQRFDYSILGDGANVAARLEGVNKEFGTPILLSETCRRQLPPDLAVREIGLVRVVGRREPIRVFEPLAATPAWLSSFAQALRHYYQGDFAAALALFNTLAATDPAAARYAECCRALAAAPPPAWDGIWVMAGK